MPMSPTILQMNHPCLQLSTSTQEVLSIENLIESLSTHCPLTQSYKSLFPAKQTLNLNHLMQGTKLRFKTAELWVSRCPVRSNRGGIINPGPAKPIKCYNCNGLGHIARECPRPKRLQNSDYFKDKMLLMQAHENGAVLDEEQSFDDVMPIRPDVDRVSHHTTMFMDEISTSERFRIPR
ncbi:retrovirus-related pol polyprotein from transposon TNT 1-94 [Tanacetum coccineum]